MTEWKIDPKLKVAVVGFASSSRNLAPFQDPTWEVWGLNSLYALIPRFSRWFEIHPREYVMKDLGRAELQAAGVDHYEWLTQQPGPDGKCSVKDKATGEPCACQTDPDKLHEFKPIYMQESYPQIPASVRWPREEINAWTVERFGAQAEVDYFTSTPGEMVVTAIFMGASEIALYGIDLLQDEEYAYQRPGCEYWVGVARGLGIKVTIPPGCALIKANYVYGYTEPPSDTGTAKPMVQFWDNMGKKLEAEQHKAAAMINTVQGCRQAFTHSVAKLKAMPEPHAPEVDAYIADMEKELVELEAKFKVGMESLTKMGAQRELAASGASWTGAWARGDKLEGM